jgi:hypothetical protein
MTGSLMMRQSIMVLLFGMLAGVVMAIQQGFEMTTSPPGRVGR